MSGVWLVLFLAIDGKAMACGTRETGKKTLVHMVSAWAEGNGLVLGQRKVDEKSNEITAIPKLLDALELAGTVVTIDAMGCQREIAARIIEKKANYVLAVKDNQGLLAEQVRDSFLLLNSDAVAEEIDCGHGRVERRRCSVLADLSMIDKAAEWASLQGLVRIESERYHKATGKTEREIRYYITSLRPDAARLNAVVRQHWGVADTWAKCLIVSLICRSSTWRSVTTITESNTFFASFSMPISWCAIQAMELLVPLPAECWIR
jgi:predicted transposase YbfD/YdcC